MISQDSTPNNFVHFKKMTITALLITFSLLISSCGNDDTDQTQKVLDTSVAAHDICGVNIDDTAWQVFAGFCRRPSEEGPPTRTEFQIFADLPIISQWKESMAGNLPSVRIVNWLEVAFSDEDDRQSDAKRNLDRRNFSNSYRYSIAHYLEIDRLILKFRTDGHCCSFRDKINFWISPDALPDSLIVAFFPSKPEIRILDNFLYVDTGVLQAGNLNQLERQLAGMLFRSTMLLDGESPTVSEGEQAVANSVRMMMNEGLIDFIQDQPGTLFSPDHPKLGKVNIVPEFVFDHGRKAISLINFHLPKMLADEAVMQKNGRNLAKTLVASSSLRQGGYSMSSTIAGHLGRQRLRDTAGSPSAWLAAYQEAARLNASPAPEPYEVSTELYRCMPPFDDDVYDGIQEILSHIFPPNQ